MGVPKFYRLISERYPCLSEIVRDHQIPEFDNLYLDMNGIIHTCSHPDDGNVHFRITEEKIISDIFHYLEVLFRMIKPRKVFFMAVDGVAPRAKMNQQRSRRFRSAKKAEVLEAQALSKGQKLPTQARFDSNCITPGTEFMVRLHTQLQYFVVSKVSTDPLWKGVRIYLSGHETPGEGEHKIMDFIRSEKALSNYDTNTRHCLYGLDADLIMLGLTTHEPHFALLREEIQFGKQAQRRSTTVEDTVFHLLHISLLREYLELEFSCVKQYMVTFTFDLERIIDDWVLMGFLVGNDFIPHLPHLHIAHDALPTIWAAYKQILPRLGGYINDKGLINMARLENFIHELSEYDFDKFEESFADNQWMASKSEASKNRQRHGRRRQKIGVSTNPDLPTGTLELPSSKRDSPDGCETQPDKPEVPSNGSAPGGLDTRVCLTSETQNGTSMELESFYDGEDSLEDGMMAMALEDMDDDGLVLPEREQEEQGMRYEFRKHKTQYYYEKMGLQTTAEVMQSQVRHYVTGLQWILLYYYQGVPSWGWFYPQHYAPFMSDLTGFADFDITFDPAQPFLPFQQLMAVLPAASGQLLPKPYRWLMTHPDSPIIHFYPAEFLTDMNGKQQDWEAVVLIPFIEEKLLIQAMSRVEGQLSASEAARNAHGPCLIYDWTEQSQGVYNSSLPSFPSIQQNHASVSRRTWRDFVVPPSRLSVAPAPSTTRFCPGFPTLAHLHHSTHLSQMGVTVFQQASQNDNRIVQILDDMDIDDIDIDSLADAYLGKSVWVNWPHLMEARAVGIETDTERVELVQSGPNKEETRVKTESDASREFLCKVESITETYMKRRGIDIGPTFVLLHATPISGRRYEYTVQSRVTISKLWQPVCQTYAIQATVTNEKMNEYGVDDVNSQQFFTLEQVFPVGSTAFLLSRSHYGCQAKVTGHSDGRIAVQYLHPREPNLLQVRRSHYPVLYLKSYQMAQTLGITSQFVSRLTGIMLMSRDRETLNIGLDLKNNKKQEECPGFSRLVVRESDGGSDWFYSSRVRDLMEQYLNRFPELCVYIQQNLSKDQLSAEEAFPENCKEKSDALLEFVRSLPTYKCPRVRAGGRFVEEPVVREIERTVDVMLEAPKQDRPKNMTVKPDQLYKSFSLSSTTLPDPHADFDLFDRVVNVRLGFTVPYGLRGTIIGIVTGPTNADTIYEVLFDAPFACGLTTRYSPGRGYRCPQHSLLNLSYGERVRFPRRQNNLD